MACEAELSSGAVLAKARFRGPIGTDLAVPAFHLLGVGPVLALSKEKEP